MSFEYFDYTRIFFFDLSIELIKNTEINEYTIKLIDNKLPFYEPIYNLSIIELEILKIYIKTHLNTKFIRLSKSFIDASILFDKKSNSSFHLRINFNNLIIKNEYTSPLINENLDCLD